VQFFLRLLVSNLRSVALTVLELLAFNAQNGLIEQSAAHRQTDRYRVRAYLMTTVSPPRSLGGENKKLHLLTFADCVEKVTSMVSDWCVGGRCIFSLRQQLCWACLRRHGDAVSRHKSVEVYITHAIAAQQRCNDQFVITDYWNDCWQRLKILAVTFSKIYD